MISDTLHHHQLYANNQTNDRGEEVGLAIFFFFFFNKIWFHN